MHYNIRSILFLSLLVSANAVLQQMEIFQELNQQGKFITLYEKIPDLKNWNIFMSAAKSYCVIGQWHFFPSTNFGGSFMDLFAGNGGPEFAYEQRKCGNFPYFGEFHSARYAGPSDTRTVGISLYEGTETFPYSGVEVVVEGRTGTYFPMSTVRAITSHGASNWTLFTGDSFQGDSWCFQSNGNQIQHGLINSTMPIRSVLKYL